MRRRILVVQEREKASEVIYALNSAGFEVVVMVGTSDLIGKVHNVRPSLLLFDVTAWSDSLEMLIHAIDSSWTSQRLSKVILACAGEMNDKIAALNAGSDDFIVQPISPRELEARLTAVLRADVEIFPQGVQSVGVVSLQRDEMAVTVGGRRIQLTRTECQLLALLMENTGRVMSREQLINLLWLGDETVGDRIVDVYILRLRKKIEEDPSSPQIIVSRRGAGYVLLRQMPMNRRMR